MKAAGRIPLSWLLTLALAPSARAADADQADLSRKAQAVLHAHCYRCHGQDGANEGGLPARERTQRVAHGPAYLFARPLERNVGSIVGQPAPAADSAFGRLLRCILILEPRPDMFRHGVERGHGVDARLWTTLARLLQARCRALKGNQLERVPSNARSLSRSSGRSRLQRLRWLGQFVALGAAHYPACP